ncbi:hypothetical protein AKO1_005420, partial [Acrasis kona]
MYKLQNSDVDELSATFPRLKRLHIYMNKNNWLKPTIARLCSNLKSLVHIEISTETKDSEEAGESFKSLLESFSTSLISLSFTSDALGEQLAVKPEDVRFIGSRFKKLRHIRLQEINAKSLDGLFDAEHFHKLETISIRNLVCFGSNQLDPNVSTTRHSLRTLILCLDTFDPEFCSNLFSLTPNIE